MKQVVGYVSAWSVAPGDTLQAMVSTYGPERYRADFVRVICGDADPAHGIYREEELAAPCNGEYPGRTQRTVAGSYGIVADAPALAALESFTLQMWIFPTTPEKGEQGLIASWRSETASGFALLIDAHGALAVRVGDGKGRVFELSSGRRLAARRWHRVWASYDAQTQELRVGQEPRESAVESPGAASAASVLAFDASPGSDAPLLFAALPESTSATGSEVRCHFNGKLDRPRLSGRALTQAELDAGDAELARDAATIAIWDFARDTGSDRFRDVGPRGMHGRLVNLPSRGVKGYNWSGAEQSWRHAPAEYGAVHFHDDDQYDLGWDVDFEYTVPADLRSGVYAVRLRAGGDESYIPFFVRPPRGTAKAKLAFLASTVTYMAYANYQWTLHERYAEVTESFWTTLEKSDVFLQEHPEFGLSTYDTHSDGSGVRYASRLRPVFNMGPKTPLWSFNADTHILGWLEAKGIDYDVITDEDLHREGAQLLERYRAVITGTHPEYYTTPMWEGLLGYLGRGGRLVYPGGNGFIWRCAVSEELPGVVELRRPEDGIRYRDEEPGEYYLEFTGEYGGLWRRLGMAPQALVGVGTVAVGFDVSGYYVRSEASFDPRARFIFEGVGDEERIGDFGFLGDGASGSEIDAADSRLGTPPHTLVVARSEGHSPNTYLVPDETGFHHCAMDGLQNPDIRADMTFFETPSGGAVFSVGSIAWSASLPHNGWDNNVSRINENVLRRFLEPKPFTPPD